MHLLTNVASTIKGHIIVLRSSHNLHEHKHTFYRSICVTFYVDICMLKLGSIMKNASNIFRKIYFSNLQKKFTQLTNYLLL